MKTIVNIISEQTIPSYLFIKEMYRPGDKLMFISSKVMSNRIQWIKDTLKWNLCESIDIVFGKNGDEENWPAMTAQIEKALQDGQEYCVNLTGGTKYMALAVQNLFSKYKSEFYYIPYPKNQILSTRESKAKPISYRVTVEEYTSLYHQPLRKAHEPITNEESTELFIDRFVNHFTLMNFEAVDKLRAYRDSKSISIEEVENKKEDTERQPRIEGLTALLEQVSFIHEGALTRPQLQYLTGGWFEDYVYFKIKRLLQPDDIVLGAKTSSTNNDLDVVFTMGNKLFVIECKTGVDRRGMLNEIVYKASALKENLFGLSAKSYIFSLGADNDEWGQAAENMGIRYCGRSWFVDDNKLDALIGEIKKQAFV